MSLRLLFLFLFLITLNACSVYKKAEKKFEKGEYDVAIDFYKKAIDEDVEHRAQALFYTAESYRLSNRLEIAAPYYKAAIDAGMTTPEVYYYYARSLKANGNYDEARRVFRVAACRRQP